MKSSDICSSKLICVALSFTEMQHPEDLPSFNDGDVRICPEVAQEGK